MDTCKWQEKVKCVAIMELIFSSAVLLLRAVFVLGTLVVILNTPEEERRLMEDKDLLVLQGVLHIVMIVLLALNLRVATMLLRAIQPPCNPEKALQRAQVWKNVSLFCLLAGVIVNFISSYYVAVFIVFVFRAAVIYVLGQYIEELESAVYDRKSSVASVPIPLVLSKV